MDILASIGTAKDSEGRRELARQVATLFFVAEERGLEAGQSDKFGEVLCKLLAEMTLENQIGLSEKMSVSPNAPRDLARALAMSEIDIAQSMIRNSTVLRDDDLIEISQSTSTDHRLAMSKRENLSAGVTDSLISFEEGVVMRSVASNKTAQISDTGFSTLARNANGDAELLQQLAQRPDLPVDSGRQIMSLLDAEGKEKLSYLMTQNGKSFDELVAKSKQQVSVEKIAESSQRISAKAYAEDVKSGRRSLSEVTSMLAQDRRAKCISVVFSAVSMLSETKVYHAVVNVDGQLLALMARALDLPFATYRQVDEMRRSLVKLPFGSEDKLRISYENLNADEAKKTMRLVNIMSNVS